MNFFTEPKDYCFSRIPKPWKKWRISKYFQAFQGPVLTLLCSNYYTHIDFNKPISKYYNAFEHDVEIGTENYTRQDVWFNYGIFIVQALEIFIMFFYDLNSMQDLE